jgi:hypothetical protein
MSEFERHIVGAATAMTKRLNNSESSDSAPNCQVVRAGVEAKNYRLKTVNPNCRVEVDTGTRPRSKQHHEEVSNALLTLRELIEG